MPAAVHSCRAHPHTKTPEHTHRKSLIVDGDVAFVGGIGIADQWAIDTEAEPRWRDTQIEVRGPAAAYVEGSFNENWIEGGEIVEPDLLPHDDAPAGRARSIVVWSGPEGGASGMKLLYLLATPSAKTSLDIQSPYFIMDESTEWSLADARRRGVRIRMVVEGDITDAKPVKFASRASYERLLERGVELHEYQPAMMHAKVMIVDGALSIFGSANFDNRPLELNDELNVAAFDPALAARLQTDFERDIQRSRKLDLERWRSRRCIAAGARSCGAISARCSSSVYLSDQLAIARLDQRLRVVVAVSSAPSGRARIAS